MSQPVFTQSEIDQLQLKMHQFGEQVYRDALASGLTWDEAVCALGTTAKALAKLAANAGDGTTKNCIERAQKVMTMGFGREVLFVREDLEH